MANALSFRIKESEAEIKKLIKTHPMHFTPRLKMLLECKRSKTPLSKNELAGLIFANHNSIQTWRKRYIEGGIAALLEYKKIGFKPSLISPAAHKKIEKKLNSPTDAFRSYKELQQWVDKEFLKGVKYITINHYVKRHFGAKLKVARKSHVNKDAEAVAHFKKNSNKK
jgi:transposase